MKKFNFYYLIFFFLVTAATVSFSKAQAPEETPLQMDERNNSRPNLLRELDLSPRQIQQIRRLNQEKRPVMQEAQERFREAYRALDRAIYDDLENESEIQTRMKEVQAAQYEVVKNRVFTERAIRRILLPEQLTRFRELRGQFAGRNNARRPNNNNRRQRLKTIPNDQRRKPDRKRPGQNPNM
ncbi:MAG: Spy/CpxP family protein refolding chaperone [Pyrinomonadaceae bacterium]